MNFDDNALVPPPRRRRAARPRRGRAASRSRPGARPELRQARRQHRLPGQRRRPGDEHDGPDQAARRRAGQLPRRRRRRQRSEQVTEAFGSCSADPNVHGGAREHLRRHHALHDDRRGRSSTPRKTVGFNVPAGRAARRDRTSRRGQADPGRERPQHHRRRRPDRRGAEVVAAADRPHSERRRSPEHSASIRS